MPRSVSILIPTHNRSELLRRTLDSLAQIVVPDGVDVEVIIVANACTDDTEQVVARAASGLTLSIRCVVEPTVGLNVARNRAVDEATGDILAFLDDDVWVYPDWLVGLCDIYRDADVGLVAGRVLFWWAAIDPPDWMCKRFEIMLSGCDHGDELIKIEVGSGIEVIGANFSFSRAVLERVGRFRHGLDRSGTSLLSGGETDFVRRARAAGFTSLYAPRVCVKHWVAPHRVKAAYLCRLAFDFGRSEIFLDPPREALPLWKELALGPARGLFSLSGAALATVTSDTATRLSRVLGGLGRFGRAAGALQLLTGRAPVQAPKFAIAAERGDRRANADSKTPCHSRPAASFRPADDAQLP